MDVTLPFVWRLSYLERTLIDVTGHKNAGIFSTFHSIHHPVNIFRKVLTQSILKWIDKNFQDAITKHMTVLALTFYCNTLWQGWWGTWTLYISWPNTSLPRNRIGLPSHIIVSDRRKCQLVQERWWNWPASIDANCK